MRVLSAVVIKASRPLFATKMMHLSESWRNDAVKVLDAQYWFVPLETQVSLSLEGSRISDLRDLSNFRDFGKSFSSFPFCTRHVREVSGGRRSSH
jgi:hypothetical protein